MPCPPFTPKPASALWPDQHQYWNIYINLTPLLPLSSQVLLFSWQNWWQTGGLPQQARLCVSQHHLAWAQSCPGLLPRANQERSWQVRQDQLGEHVSWYGLQLPETKHQQPKHSIRLRLHHALWKNSLLHPARTGNHHSHSWWDSGNQTEAGNVWDILRINKLYRC